MLYLVDKPMADVAFRTVRDDASATVVLIQDGVLLDPDVSARTFAVARDVAVRGVELPPGVEPIPYETLVELVFDHEVRSFV